MGRNKTRIRLLVCVMFLLTLGSACQSALQRGPVSAGQDQTPPAPLSVESLDRRMLYLSRLLETQDLSIDDRELAQDLLTSYKGLKTAARSGSLKQTYAPMIHMLLRNLEQMEDRYFAKQAGGESLSSEGIRQLAIKRKQIMEAFSEGNDQAVIDGIVDLEKTLGSQSLTPDLSLLFALSLGKKGTFTTALSVGRDVTAQLEGKPDLVRLRAQMIDWQLALGNEKEAKEIYQRLQLLLGQRDALVRSLEQKISPEDSGASLTDSAGPGHGDATAADTEAGLREALAKAEDLMQKGDFERAKFILFQQRIRFDEGSEAERIDQALQKVEAAEEQAGQQRKTEVAAVEPEKVLRQDLQQEEQKQDILKTSLDLIRSEKYEQALVQLDALPPADPEVKQLRNMAVEKIINRERNKAAKLFLAARNTKEPARKKDLLTSSYSILKAVSEKYPSSPLSAKIQDHMNQVTKELAKVE